MKLVNLTILYTLNEPIKITRKPNFSGQIIKRKHCSFTLFSTGKIIVTGPHSFEEKLFLLQQLFRDLNLDKIITSWKVINAVFVGKVKLIKPWYVTTSKSCLEYEPELFPACYWRSGKYLVSLFSSGKYIITGVRNELTAHSLEKEFLRQISDLL